MENTLARYKAALDKIGAFRLLALPDSVKTVIQNTNDLEAKTKMFELIVAQLGL